MKKICLLCCFFYSILLTAQDQFNPTEFDFFDNRKEDLFGTWKIKNMENTFKKVTEKRYMNETEVTNQQYGYFLGYLLSQKNYDALLVAKAEKTDWRSLLPEGMKQYSDEQIFKHGHSDAEAMPLQNIDYQGAILFCKWLTDSYMKEDISKRKWKNVVFRLPTEQEWITAASAGKAQAKYPWGSDSPRNPKGCYLSNFNCRNEPCSKCAQNAEGEQYVQDGGFFTVRADAYYPNALGLFGMSGNVAEMVQEKGIAKGGSWEDVPSECTIQAQKKYDKPSPAIGFRVIMEILE